jgi:acylphosphatase
MVLLAKIKIFGRVQGVFFRRSAKKKAEEFGIVGFIRNESDDESVYLEAQGEEENLKKFIEWCRKGPPLAKVQNLEVNYLKEIKPYTQFLIL